MQLTVIQPKTIINKAYLKEKISRSEIERFKSELSALLSNCDNTYSEDTLKDMVGDFLKNVYYRDKYFISINKERKDLAIHTGKNIKDPVGIITEVKRLETGEMISAARPNSKAFHELVLYYLYERVKMQNLEIKQLVATNVYEWFFFDANEFDKKIFRNQSIRKLYDVYVNDKKDNTWFYSELKTFLEGSDDPFTCAFLDLKALEPVVKNSSRSDDNKLITAFKVLSPEHLLKKPFANDSNNLDKNFYNELLHIIGLEEVKDGSKKLIKRKSADKRSEASLLENTIIKLQDHDVLRNVSHLSQSGENHEEQLQGVALDLCITWINRVLFLKLLEAQLFQYHRNDSSSLFLNSQTIFDYDELNNLFFQILAEKPENRRSSLKDKFKRVPYLNSSLFERTALERTTINISSLDNRQELPLYGNTVLKQPDGKKASGQLPALDYLFRFLDAYDFTSEGKAEIQEENKTLINASVLGLIFEKINGYKDGSFFTPGFITMYMCRETLRRAVVQKFNEAKGWDLKDFDALYDAIEDRHEANAVINSLRVCDPAVGSGHFLVSALNELIAIKSELRILLDRQGKRLKEYTIQVENDELVITDEEGDPFSYHPGNAESQRIQETLFHEKEKLIENCLFGVDINANSTKICRLRLWIELLKHAYYTHESGYTQLETLPNIDINIKEGNSLVSRYDLDADVTPLLMKKKWDIQTYKLAVQNYKNAQTKEEKREFEELIQTIKSDFRTEIATYDPLRKKLSSKRGEMMRINQTKELFGGEEKKKKEATKYLEKLSAEIDQLESELKEAENNKIYANAFEWRFEFPEVLDNNGNFIGFDVVIGNPPYVQLQKLGEEQIVLGRSNYTTYSKLADLYCLFYEKGVNLLKKNGFLCFITSNSWMRTKYGTNLREFLITKSNPLQLLNLEDTQIFEEATVESNILLTEKALWSNNLFAITITDKSKGLLKSSESLETKFIKLVELPVSGWVVGSDIESRLRSKLEKGSKSLGSYGVKINRGFTTGFNEAFFIPTEVRNKLISEDSNSERFIQPALRGKDITKYSYEWANLWMILIKQGWTNKFRNAKDPELFVKETIPAIYNHLKKTGDEIKGKGKGLFERDDKGDYWWELRPCVYCEEFKKDKIIWGELSDTQKFAYDSKSYLANNTVFFMTGRNLKYLLAILNSKIGLWYFKLISTSSGMGTNRWLKYKIEQLPVPEATELQIARVIELVDKIIDLKANRAEVDISRLQKEIDECLYQCYSLTTEEILIVEQSS